MESPQLSATTGQTAFITGFPALIILRQKQLLHSTSPRRVAISSLQMGISPRLKRMALGEKRGPILKALRFLHIA